MKQRQHTKQKQTRKQDKEDKQHTTASEEKRKDKKEQTEARRAKYILERFGLKKKQKRSRNRIFEILTKGFTPN